MKYEEVYLRAYPSVPEARASIGRYLEFYNRRRPHSSLGGQPPTATGCAPACRRPLLPQVGQLSRARQRDAHQDPLDQGAAVRGCGDPL